MADKLSNHESKNKKEVQIVDAVLQLGLDILDSAEFAEPKVEPKTIGLANQMFKKIDEISTQIPNRITIQTREVRPSDYIKPGEHPGIWLKAEYPNNITLEINIHGGIRDARGQSEYNDSTNRFSKDESHEERTIGLANKSTQVNIQFKTGGVQTDEAWFVDTPGQKASVAITSIKCNSTNSDQSVIFREETQPVYHKNFHAEIKAIASQCLNVLN
jgi:hypothetical protein